jgi:hypothetical protein
VTKPLEQTIRERLMASLVDRVLEKTGGRLTLNTQETADLLGVGEQTVRGQIAAGFLKAQRPGKAFIIAIPHLFDYLENADLNHLMAQSGNGQ